MAKLDALYCKKLFRFQITLKKNKRIDNIHGRNICICLNEIVVRTDIHL